MAQTTTTLPDGYQLYFEMDLQKDRKLALRVNGLALLLAAVLLVLGLLWHSWREWMNTDHFFLRSIVLIVGMIGYLFLHEWVHGIFMKHFSGVKAQYGFTGLYAYAGSGAYFNRKQYIIIAMAPVVIWGVVLLACMLAVGGVFDSDWESIRCSRRFLCCLEHAKDAGRNSGTGQRRFHACVCTGTKTIRFYQNGKA